jgi:hypothetical protein
VKKVFFAGNRAGAQRVRDLLAEQGIAAEISTELRRRRGSRMPFDLTPGFAVWIADESRSGEAERLIAELSAPGSGAPWTCRACGNEITGEFTACWRCGAEREA